VPVIMIDTVSPTWVWVWAWRGVEVVRTDADTKLEAAVRLAEALDVDDLERLASTVLERLDQLRPVDPAADVLAAIGQPLTRQDLEDLR